MPILKKYNFISNPDLFIELINNNNIFTNMIKIVYNQYKSQIISGKYDKISKSKSLISSIEIYCMINDIEIKEEDTEEIYYTDGVESTDPVKAYLRDIAKIPLLSVEKERELALKIEQGDSNARSLFVESNLRLVVSVAKRYCNRGVPFLDLIQEGNIGLMKAIDKYDVKREIKFSTYAVWWIRQAIERAITDKSRNIRLPVHLYEKIGAYKKTVAKLEDKLNRQPTTNEIAKEMGLTISQVTNLNKLQTDTVSINTLIGDKDTELENFIPAFEKTPEDIVINKTLRTQIWKELDNCNLKAREKNVLKLRTGYIDGEPKTLEQISKEYGITRERVRQIEAKALEKIRKSYRYKRSFAEYMNDSETALKKIDEFSKKYNESPNSFKTFLNDDGRTKVKEKDKMKKVLTIYEILKEFTRKQIDEMIKEKLTDEERELIKIRYGEDLNNPTPGTLSSKQKNYFYNTLIPRMRKILENPNYKRYSISSKEKKTLITEQAQKAVVQIKDKPTSEQKSIPTEEKTQINPMKVIENDNEGKLEQKTESIKELNPVVKSDDTSNNLTKDDYIKMLELLRTPTFEEMHSLLTKKELIIIYLSLGYIDGKYFSAKAIAQFLEIEETEVKETTNKVLLLYKDYINNVIDSLIKGADEKVGYTRVLSMNPTNKK